MSPGQAVAAQQPDWPDPDLLDGVRAALGDRPPLVGAEEVRQLARALAAAGRGEALVLQGGDCAELFDDAGGHVVRRKVAQLNALARSLGTGAGLPVVRLGRIAGQYAKPRTSCVERLPAGRELPSYRGDAVNHAGPGATSRIPDPRRLLTAYDRAAETLAAIRATWAAGPAAERVYASHELLLLDYELPLVRDTPAGRYASSCHSGWVGERTRSVDGAHVLLAGSVANPVGVKVGPAIDPDEAVELSLRLNPEGRCGHLALIVRMGAEHVDAALPGVAAAVARRGAPVLWLCDPMHGNTVRTAAGRKTRVLGAMKRELASFVRVLRAHRQWPGGLHLELTPDDVTECVATPGDALARVPLPRYRTALDPRLNPAQAAELVRHLVALL